METMETQFIRFDIILVSSISSKFPSSVPYIPLNLSVKHLLFNDDQSKSALVNQILGKTFKCNIDIDILLLKYNRNTIILAFKRYTILKRYII